MKICPICGNLAIIDTPQTPNGGQLYIAEEFDNCTECYAPSITGYTCSKNKEHTFYIVEDKNNE